MVASLGRVARSPGADVSAGRRHLGSPRNYTLLLVLAVVWAFFYVQTDGTFLTQRNLVLLALQTSIVSLAAISAVMLIVSRNFDLSVGSAVALVGVVLAVLTVNHDVDPLLAVLAALACGIAMGVWQGFWVTRLGVSSFIVTLAGMLYFRGLSMIITNGATVAPLPKSLTAIATGFLPPSLAIPLLLAAAAAYLALEVARARRAAKLGASSAMRLLVTAATVLALTGIAVWLCLWKGLPYLVLLVACCAVGAEVVMRRTHFGTQIYAVGSNPEAARLSGIDLQRVVFWNFVLAGVAYGITGIALTARVGGAIGGSAGLFLELDAIAAAVIGGTALRGGQGRVLGALVGGLLMGSLNNGMSLMNVPTFYQDTARGIVLLLAVALDQFSRRRARGGRLEQA